MNLFKGIIENKKKIGENSAHTMSHPYLGLKLHKIKKETLGRNFFKGL